jgi:4-hydroxybenzoate polyprenyltransferase
MNHGKSYLVPDVFWAKVGSLSIAGICLYIAGNFLNDWMDRDWDQTKRPERALPRGLFKPIHYLTAAFLLAFSGVLLAAHTHLTSGIVAAGIVITIVIYTIWHKQTAWAVIPIGICRALLPMMSAVAIFHDILPLCGLSLGILSYIVALSLSARCESKSDVAEISTYLSYGLFLAVPLMMLSPFYWVGNTHMIFYLATIPYGIWIILCRSIFRKPISRYVSALLAGIPIVDWIPMISLGGIWTLGSHSPSLFGTTCLIFPLIAFVAALFLQRLAPAT